MKRFLKKALIFFIFLITLGVILSHFSYIDIKGNCYIKIMPSFLPGNWNAKEIMEIIKQDSPNEYRKICENIHTINKRPSCGGLDGGCFEFNSPGTIFVGSDINNPAIAASVFIHETCHHIDVTTNEGKGGEKLCYTEGYKFLKNYLVSQ